VASAILTRGLTVRIRECTADNCNPKASKHGFVEDGLYQCLAITDYSETSEAFMLLVNDAKEFWFIPSRSCRFEQWNTEAK